MFNNNITSIAIISSTVYQHLDRTKYKYIIEKARIIPKLDNQVVSLEDLLTKTIYYFKLINIDTTNRTTGETSNQYITYVYEIKAVKDTLIQQDTIPTDLEITDTDSLFNILRDIIHSNLTLVCNTHVEKRLLIDIDVGFEFAPLLKERLTTPLQKCIKVDTRLCQFNPVDAIEYQIEKHTSELLMNYMTTNPYRAIMVLNPDLEAYIADISSDLEVTLKTILQTVEISNITILA